jgi:hypothetical protein
MKVKMRIFPSPRKIIVHDIQQWWICCDQSPRGRLLVVELDYLHLVVVGPHSLTERVWGGLPPTTVASRGDNSCSPPGRGFGGNDPKVKFWEKIPCKIV